MRYKSRGGVRMRAINRIGIIADDFTGANDTGVQFGKKGLETIVLAGIENITDIINKTDVIVIDTDSRADNPKLAYEKVKATTKALKEAGIDFFYKKIDSTCRGNIGQELDAVMDELETNISIVVPAFPATGRLTIGGYQLLNQVPLEKTEIAHDPFSPVTESHIPTLIQNQSKRKVGHITLSTVMKGSQQLIEEIKRKQREGEEIIVVDAATQDDLKIIAEAIASGLTCIACGPAGIAEELPEALGLLKGKEPLKQNSVVCIAGSISVVTRQQISKAEEVLDILIIDLDPCKILKSEEMKERELERTIEKTKKAIEEGKDVIVTSAKTKDSVIKARQLGEELGIESVEVSMKIGTALGELSDKIAEIGQIAGLILTGGYIAIHACRTMGAIGAKIVDEVLPGIPAGILVGGKHDGLKIITKAGAFGKEEAIVEAITYLKKW